MACPSITSVVGVSSGGPTADSVRVDGNATDCKEILVEISCVDGSMQGLAIVEAGLWTIAFSDVGQLGCACGLDISVIATCTTDGCADKTGLNLPCSQCCPTTSVSVTSVCQPTGTREVTFTASIAVAAGCAPVQIRWDFGDSTTSVVVAIPPPFGVFVVSHVYPGVGVFAARLDVLSPTGCPPLVQLVGSDTPCPAADCRRITDLTISVSGCAGAGGTALATFTGVLNAPAPGCTFHWQFGDGTPQMVTTSPSVTHAYALPGTFPVAVTVVCGTTCIETTTVSAEIDPCCPEIDDVRCSVQCSDSDLSQAQVTCVVTTVPSGAPGVFVWDFDDGSAPQTTSVPSVSHAFSTPGQYDVSVTLTPTAPGCPQAAPETTLVSVACAPPDDGGGWDWCLIGRASIVILLILALIATYIALCVPGAALPGGITAAALAVAAAILIGLWLVFCDQPCSWGLLFAWEVSLGAGIGALYFAACCPTLWWVGLGLIAAGLAGLAWWRRRCRVDRCGVLKELIIVFSGVILPVIGWIAGIPALVACLSGYVAAVVGTLSGILVLLYAGCNKKG